MSRYQDLQSDEIKLLLRDLIDRPDAYVKAIERYAVSVASIVGWGRRIEGFDDYVAQQALAIMETIDLTVPASTWTETIPELVRVPMFIHAFPHVMRMVGKMVSKYFELLTREAAAAREDSGLARILVDNQAEYGISDAEIGHIAGNVIGGGVDTTAGSILTFLLAMCCFPDVQAKAQEELDRVVGQDRMPGPEDAPNLPYVAAMVKETLRWRTVTILAGIPHAPLADDVYDKYTIPKKTAIIGNMWAIHRSPRDFVEPDRFRPERYLDGLERPYPVPRGHHAFGFGRRVCSGQPLAEQGLALSLAKLLWAFDIRPGLDATVSLIVHPGAAPPHPPRPDFITPRYAPASLTRQRAQQGKASKLDIFAYTNGENMRPQPFPAAFEPRSDKIKKTIYEEAAKAREALREYDGETKLTLKDVGSG